MPQYSDLLAALTQQNSEKTKSFDCNDNRLDDFFFNESAFKMPTELQSVLKLILVLSHEQANVERGFNVNNIVLNVNGSEKSVVSRKLIIDHMQKNNLLPSTIELTNKLIRSVKTARQRYQLDPEQQKKNAKHDEGNQHLEILSSEIKDVIQKKLLLLEACENLDQEFVNIISEAEKKNDIRLVMKGNGLKRKGEEKRKEIETLDKTINVLEEKRKKVRLNKVTVDKVQ